MCKRERSLSLKKGFSRGQVAIEYILLLLVVVSVALIMSRFTISQEGGFLIIKWRDVVRTMGSDYADSPEVEEEP